MGGIIDPVRRIRYNTGRSHSLLWTQQPASFVQAKIVVDGKSDPENQPGPSPAPWTFHTIRHNFRNVVVDAGGRYICAHVMAADGRLIAAAPTMLAVLIRIAAIEGEHSRTGSLARRAILRAQRGATAVLSPDAVQSDEDQEVP